MKRPLFLVPLLALAAACAAESSDDAVDATGDAVRLKTPIVFHGSRVERFDATMPDVDTIGLDLRFDLDASKTGDEAYRAETKSYYAATRALDELTLDFATGTAAGAKANVIEKVELVRLADGAVAEDIPVAKLRIDAAAQKVVVPFARPIPAGTGFTLRIVYQGKALQADGVDPDDFTAYGGFMAKQHNSAGKRIFLSLDWPNKAHWWLPLRDHPRDGFMTYLDVGVPEGMTVLGNGARTLATGAGGEARVHFLETTPMPAYDLHLAAYDGWVSEPFPRSSGGGTAADAIPMSIYAYDAKTEYLGDADHDPNTPDTVVKSVPTIEFARQEYALERDAMNFYIEHFGPFRYGSVDFVEEPIFGGGMEHASVVSMDETRFEGSQDGQMRYTAYHELAHHWSGNLARIATWNDFWMSEGFTEYLTVRFALSRNDRSYLHTMYRYSWLSESGRRLRGPSAPPKKLLHPVAPRADFPGLEIPASGEVNVLNIFDALVYQKGAMVLVMLEQRLGTDAFTAFLADWFANNAGRAVTTEQFQQALVKRFPAHAEEIGPFFDQFVYGTYRPEVRVTATKVAGGTELRVEQLQQGVGPANGYRFPLDVDVVDGAGATHRVTIDVKERVATLTVPYETVTSFVANPAETMLVAVACSDTEPCAAGYECVAGASSLAVQPPTPAGGETPPVVDPLKLCRPQ